MSKIFISVLLFFSLLTPAYAADMTSPVGDWVTISDITHDRASMVRIWQQNGVLYGKIMKIFPGPDRPLDAVCEKCTGDLKNKPVVGMIILWGYTQDNANSWTKGRLLDPRSGKVFDGTITLLKDGEQLQLTGHWGVFKRTQIWIRE